MSTGGPAELRRRLADLTPGLRPVAETVLTESGRIDVVALDEKGRAVAAFDAQGEDLATFTRALAATAWLDRHLPDWCQIAPDLGIDPATPARALLVATSFDPDTRAAAERLRAPQVELLETEAAAEQPADAPDRIARPPRPGGPRRPSAAASSRREPSTGLPSHPFRTGLTDADLGVAAVPTASAPPRGSHD